MVFSWNLFLKNPLQDLLSSLNGDISTNESTRIITGHVIYNPAYTYLQIPTENHLDIAGSAMQCRGQLARFFTIIRFNWMRSYARLLYHSHSQKRSIHYSTKRAIASEPGYEWFHLHPFPFNFPFISI